MNAYPAKLAVAADGITVTFRDIPEAITSGDTREQAVREARNALETAMEFYVEDNRSVPAPSEPKRGEVLIALTASTSAKILLLNAMVAQRLRPVDLAKTLGTSRQNVNRLLDINHATKIDAIQDALEAIGQRLELRSVAA